MNNSVQINSTADVALHLVSAVLLYQSNNGHVYATQHAMQIDADRPERKVIGPGTPLTKNGLAEFAAMAAKSTAFAGFIPENMVYSSADMIAWWTPAAIRNTWFVGGDRGIGEAQGPAAHPAMVFVALAQDYYVFALAESSRPNLETALSIAPHFNVWEGGRVCAGNVRLPPTVTTDAIGAYEDAFFRSRFTHPNQEAAVSYQGGMAKLWQDQLAEPDSGAMAGALKPAGETLGGAIKRISKQLHNHH